MSYVNDGLGETAMSNDAWYLSLGVTVTALICAALWGPQWVLLSLVLAISLVLIIAAAIE
jgi:hypothetical protein